MQKLDRPHRFRSRPERRGNLAATATTAACLLLTFGALFTSRSVRAQVPGNAPGAPPSGPSMDYPSGNAGQFNGNVNTAGSYDPVSGNATRTVVDLTVPGAIGDYGLAFARTANSRGADPMSTLFGEGGNWRHNYQYDLKRNGIYQWNGSAWVLVDYQYSLLYPDGRAATFFRLPSNDGRYAAYQAAAQVQQGWVVFYGPYGTRDRLDVTNATQPTLLMADGGRITFEIYSQDSNSASLRATAVTDPHGKRTTLTYWQTNWVRFITEPGGRFLQVDYKQATAGSNVRAVIASVIANTGGNVQSVGYNYGACNSGAGNAPFVVLAEAGYSSEPTAGDPGSPVKAQYGYGGGTGGAPLLAACADPHYPGAMWRINYAFDPAVWGRVTQEVAPQSGEAVSSLNSGTANDEFGGQTRQETRGERGPDGQVLARSFGYWPSTGFLHYFTDYTGGRRVFQYDRWGYQTTINDWRNNQTVFLNEPHVGAVSQVNLPPDQHGVSHSVRLGYGDAFVPYLPVSRAEQVTSTGNANNDWHVTFYDRDGFGRIWRIRYPDGGYEQFAFDDSADGCGQLASHRLATGGYVTFVYGHSAGNTRGLLQSKTESDGAGWSATTTYAYDGLDRLQTVTDARGNQTVLAYNARHQIVRVTHPQDPTRVRYPDGQSGVNYSTFTYDDQGNRLTTTNECSYTTTVSYDGFRRPVLTQDALGHCVFLSNEARSRAGAVVSGPFTHTRGAWTTSMRPSYADGARFKHSFRAFDGFFRVVREVGGLGGTDGNWPNVVSGGDASSMDSTYDADGNLVAVTDALNRVTTYAVDSRGRRTSMTLPADGQFDRTTTYDFDGVGNLLQETRPASGGRFLYAYDAMNRRLSVTDPANHVTQTVFSYQGGGVGANLTTIDPNNNAYVLQSDGLGRRVHMNYPGGTSETWHYDAAGNVDTFTNRAGQVQTSAYDNRNWLTATAWNTGGRSTTHYHYADGLPYYDYVDNQNGVAYYRDATGKVTTEYQSPDAGLPWTSIPSVYDDDNSRTQLNHPSGDYELFRYNDRGQLARQYYDDSQTAFLVNAYSSDGRPQYRFRISGMQTGYTFDQGGRLTSLNLFLGTPSSPRGGIDYGYDALTRRQWNRRQEDGRGDRYTYGIDDQLTFVNQEALNVNTASPTGDQRQSGFGYDAAGNRTVSNTAGANNAGNVSYTNTDILNRYRTLNGASVGYDANSNLTYEPLTGSTYVYDADNRLVRAVNPQTGVDRAYAYDALGRCVWQQDNGGAKTYRLYDGANLIEERGGPGGTFSTLGNRYVYGAGTDEPILLVRPDGSGFYYHQDANGNVVALSDTGGNIIERYHYDPFGRPLVCDASGAENRGDTSLYGNRFLFTGREWQGGLKLYDYRARAYSPSLGRFLQADPAGFGGGNHLYRYCGNDSVNGSDPSGMFDLGAFLHSLWDHDSAPSGLSPGSRPLTGSLIPGGESVGPLSIEPGASFSPGVSDTAKTGNTGGSSSSGAGVHVGTTSTASDSELSLPAKVAIAILNIPNDIVGLAVGIATIPFGGRPDFSAIAKYGALIFSGANIGNPNTGGGITFGNVIIFVNTNPGDPTVVPGTSFLDHELEHIPQGGLLGPFYTPANLIGGALGFLINGDYHGSGNFMEAGPRTPGRPAPFPGSPVYRPIMGPER